MKKLLNIFIAACTALAALSLDVRAASEPLFPLPQAPDDLVTLQQRCNYLVEHYWDRCNFNQAFRNRPQLNQALGNWFDLMTLCTADTAHMAIDRLLDRFKKSGPETLELAKMAEGWLWSDTASVFSDELYQPFAKAAANCKRISGADRARFVAHTKILDNSMQGKPLPSVKSVDANGNKLLLSDIKGENILLFFNDPDCADCSLTT